MSNARKTFQIPGAFAMRRGGSLASPSIAYETWGELNAARDNAVLIFTGLSPSAHASSSPADPAPGWWEEIVGPSRPIDTRRYFVICTNSLGSCFGSTGPASIDPVTGKPYRLGFPVLTLEDVANAGHAVLRHLGVERLHTVVGPSMGGTTTLAFAAQYPGIAERLLLISCGPRSLPFAIALRSLQREMIRRDPGWENGNYAAGAGPITGMRLARKLGMMTYRSPIEWEQRFGRERIAAERQSGDSFGLDFEIEAYLEAHAQKFTGQFDPNCYLYLSRASDLFDIAEHGGSVAAGLGRIRAKRAMVIGVATDFLFPLHQQRELAEGLRAGVTDVELVELPSIQGHDSFLVDMDRFRPVIQRFFPG
ncbi:MAG: homoserine O-acetyltransferase [Gammaproteobacteria bacterium]|nr:homoserine O-acetyltransferase [Gammaproteobacteria bacterium]